MTTYNVAVIPGDGIGKEVVPVGLRILREVSSAGGFDIATETFPWSGEHYLKTGEILPPNGLEELARFDAIYLGAVGNPKVPDTVTVGGLLLPLRKTLDLYVNYRPIKLLEGVSSPLKAKTPKDIDFVCVRENTEGAYSWVGGRVHRGTEYESAMQTIVFTRYGVERIVRYAFEEAQKRKKKLTSITKSNAMQYVHVFWDEVVNELAKEYPDVEVRHVLIDAATVYFVTQPESFDVVVAPNLFGDILTDLGGAIQGGLGLAASANFNPDRKTAMFEPVHGSAPNIAGQGIANPMGSIWSASLMLDWLGEKKAAAQVLEAMTTVLHDGKVRTPDLGGSSSTTEVGDAVIKALQGLLKA